MHPRARVLHPAPRRRRGHRPGVHAHQARHGQVRPGRRRRLHRRLRPRHHNRPADGTVHVAARAVAVLRRTVRGRRRTVPKGRQGQPERHGRSHLGLSVRRTRSVHRFHGRRGTGAFIFIFVWAIPLRMMACFVHS